MDPETGVYCQGLGMDCSCDTKVNEELEIINELYNADSGKGVELAGAMGLSITRNCYPYIYS